MKTQAYQIKSQYYTKSLVLLCCIGLLAACSKEPMGSYDKTAHYEASAGVASAKGKSADLVDEMMNSRTNQTQHATVNGKERQFVKTANVSFQVKDVYKTAITLEDMAANVGGFVIHNHVSNDITQSRTIKTDNGIQTVLEQYQPSGSITLRIPQKKLQVFLRNMVKHAQFMYSRSFDAQDVLLDILKQQQLAKINDTANTQINQNLNQKQDTLGEKVYATNTNATYQHAKLLAQIQKAELEDKVAFSTITILLRQSPLVRSYTQNYFPYEIEKAQPSLAYQVEESLEAGWENFLRFMVGLVSLWPFFIFFTGLFFIWRVLRKWWRTRKTKAKSLKNV